MSDPIDLDAIKANLPKPCPDRKYTNDIGQVLFTADRYCTGCGHERGLPHRRDCPATKEIVNRRAADEAVAVAQAIGVFALIAEVERLRADLDRALTDGAASHGRYLAADSDYRHQSEKAARHWQERCQAITERDNAIATVKEAAAENKRLMQWIDEDAAYAAGRGDKTISHGLYLLRQERDDARLALAMARGEGWPEGWKRGGQLIWDAPDGKHSIERAVLPPSSGERAWICGWNVRDRGALVDLTVYPDLLAALRAYQAMVTP